MKKKYIYGSVFIIILLALLLTWIYGNKESVIKTEETSNNTEENVMKTNIDNESLQGNSTGEIHEEATKVENIKELQGDKLNSEDREINIDNIINSDIINNKSSIQRPK